MALCGVAFGPAVDGRDAFHLHWIGARRELLHRRRRSVASPASRGWRGSCCCSPGRIEAELESRRATRTGVEEALQEEEEEAGPVIRFEMSDFAVSNHVSVGLHGRSDELIFEATVSDPESPLFNSTVVLRQLTSRQAKRRGRRALEVLKKLARRQLMYHSYSMQVHGYVPPSSRGDDVSFILVHGYHGSYSLRHWLQLSDWLPTLEATLALDEDSVRRVGDDTTGGPAVTRQLRLTRILMRDLLIGVNYLHSHGLAHTELRLENVHISPVDKHVKVGILGNSVDFYDSTPDDNNVEVNADRRKLMIAFDMRCVGFIMAKMIMRELMDASIFQKFKAFLTKGNDPSCLREFLLPILSRNSPSGDAGLQMLDRNWGAGWNLLSLLLATKPSGRISCLDALRHPFLCGPRWRVYPSMDVIRWGLGSTAVRMAEDYIYVHHQHSRIAYFIELMELLNSNRRPKEWLDFLPGRWRLLFSTGRHIGLTFRQPIKTVLVCNAHLTFTQSSVSDVRTFSLISEITFKIMPRPHWPHDKSGTPGSLRIESKMRIAPGRRFYPKEEDTGKRFTFHKSSIQIFSVKNPKQIGKFKELPSSLPAVKFVAEDINISMNLEASVDVARQVLQEVRTQIPSEMFDVSKFICGTYVDSRMMVIRGVSGSALLFTRSCQMEKCT